MFVGTASDVGKSIITAGFCRIFRQDGHSPAPFKAQNMSLNSYATPEGLEIGRAQAVQAEAAGIPCHVDMNPVLLKPTSDQASQVVLNGRPIGTQSAYEYFRENDRHELFQAATQAYDRLAARYAPIVLEGAGSISELNLKRRDITNLRMARHAGAATYLIADIDRGGVFGSVFGTLALLEPEEKACIKGIIINKFRGDARLFEDGRQQLAELTGVPVVGVLPYFRDIFIEEEDSVALARKQRQAGPAGRVRVAVVLLGRLSNFTDFDALAHDPRADLFFTRDAAEIGGADIIILPGSKNTIADLLALTRSGLGATIAQARRAGKPWSASAAATRCWAAPWKTPMAQKAPCLPPLAWACCPCARCCTGKRPPDSAGLPSWTARLLTARATKSTWAAPPPWARPNPWRPSTTGRPTGTLRTRAAGAPTCTASSTMRP